MQHVQPKTGETMHSVPPGTGIRGAGGGAGGAGEGPLLQLELQLLEEGVRTAVSPVSCVDNTNDEHVYNEYYHDNKHQEEEGREEANDAMERKEWTKLSSSQSPDYENRFAGLAGKFSFICSHDLFNTIFLLFYIILILIFDYIAHSAS